MDKKVILLSYYWPPAGGPGVQRWVKMTKYLAQLGYSIDVVTVDPKKASYPALDPSLLKDVDPRVKVTFTNSFEALHLFARFFKKEKIPYAGIPHRSQLSPIGKIALFIRSNFFIPDARVGWNKHAIKAASKIIKKKNIDYLITTSPPHSTQVAGLHLKKKFPHLKWLADLRDPWTDIYYYKRLAHSRYSAKKDLNIEKKVLLKSDLLVTVSEPIAAAFMKKCGEKIDAKMHVLPNGFDPDDFPEEAINKNDVFTLAHTGTLNVNYNLSEFLKAARTIIASGKKIEFLFAGNVDDITKKKIADALGDSAKFLGYMSHLNAIHIMRKADLLLLAIPDMAGNEGILTGKLFEYLASGKPILAIGPPKGSAAKIVKECLSGKVFDFADPDVGSFIAEIYKNWTVSADTSHKNTIFRKYSRSELSAQLSILLSEMV